MKKILIILFVLITLLSCNNKFPDYTEKDDGVYMKLESFEESDKNIIHADYITASIEVIGDEGLLYKHYKEDVINLKNHEFTFLLQHLNEGDSCSFMVAADRIIDEFKPITFNETTSEYVEVIIKIHHCYTTGEYLSKKRGYDKEMMEQLILTKYLKELKVKKKLQGIYVEQLLEGTGKEIEKGDVITINYKGYFVNRLEFDNTYKQTPFTFTYGTPDQVIKGLDIAINRMKKGEKSKIIVPSQFAFGEVGSTTRIVPTFTTVIYELEIVNVK